MEGFEWFWQVAENITISLPHKLRADLSFLLKGFTKAVL